MSHLVEIATLVVKVASRCNMDCDYCYIYHSQDYSWHAMPTTMPLAVMQALVEELGKIHQIQQTKPQVVFHGGEPLLAGVRQIGEFVEALVQRIPDISLSIQTNGTIYNSALEQLLHKYRTNLAFSISVDGFRVENDRHRVSLKGQSVYDRIDTTLKKAQKSGVLDNILMVVDIRNDPARIHKFMLETGASNYNIILQDGDYDHLPPGKTNVHGADVGRWLWCLFKLYSSGPQVFRLKFFDDIALSLLKLNRGLKTPNATYSLCTITVDTNGELKQADTFRINRDGADQLGGSNIISTSLYELANSSANKAYLLDTEELGQQCLHCKYLDACGGGYSQHRYKAGSYANPSVYCSDYMYLYKKMEVALCH